MNMSASYVNTPVADGALNIATGQSQNFASAQTRNAPVEAQTPNRVSSPEQVAAVLHDQQTQNGGVNLSRPGSLLDVRV